KAKEMATEDMAESWNGIGVSYRYEEKWPDAVKAYDEAIKLAPKNWSYYNNKGIALQRIKGKDGKEDPTSVSDAETAFKKAVELAPKEFDPLNNLGICYRKESKWDDAISAYKKALEIDPKAGDTWFDIASMYLKKDDYANSLDAFQKYLDL